MKVVTAKKLAFLGAAMLKLTDSAELRANLTTQLKILGPEIDALERIVEERVKTLQALPDDTTESRRRRAREAVAKAVASRAKATHLRDQIAKTIDGLARAEAAEGKGT